MVKFLSALMLCLIILQTLVLPATVQAFDPGCPFTSRWLVRDFSVTDITSTTAVGHFNFCLFLTGPIVELLLAESSDSQTTGLPVVEYGTEPGVFTHRVSAIRESSAPGGPGAAEADGVRAGNLTISLCQSYTFPMEDLTPCTTYYVRFFLAFPLPGCPEPVLRRELSFTTLGCRIGSGSHGAGGLSGLTPTSTPLQLSNIVVQTAAISQSAVAPGENVEVTATLANKGGSNGSARVTLYVNGQEADSKGVAVTGGETTPVHFFTNRSEPGTYQVYVNGTSAGSFTVDSFAGKDAMIYAVIALFTLGIAGVLYLLVRRRTV